ncbi:MAG: class I SAM-dependent methyltransferase [Planctomycetaceae bacterium]|nr:class I SAM-dependent methyltransferase [Planctomycetaceae bacterium]
MPERNSPSLSLILPETGEALTRDDAAQALLGSSSETRIPIQDGIPRFTQAEHLESFGRQWNRYEVAHDDEDRATFQAKTGISLSELAGMRVLDAGCGGGRYCKVAAEADANVVGVDYTHAVNKAAQLCSHLPNVQFIQADLKRLPFPPESFDFVFSIGVMHHDADTRKVFDSVARMVRPGGRMAIWLYRRNQWWQEWINTALRRRTTAMPPDQLERWCEWGAWLGGLPLINRTLNKIVNFSAHPNYENRVCDTFDWYAPQYQYHHTVEELCRWYEEAGFVNLKVLPPEKNGAFYRWVYEQNLLIGSGVNVLGQKA